MEEFRKTAGKTKREAYGKKVLSLVLAVSLFLFLIPASAAGTPVFTIVNDQVLPLSDGTMPQVINGKYYVPYSVFTNIGAGIHGSYYSSEQILMMYDSNRLLTFDLKTASVTDQDRNVYNEMAVIRNGRVYVPMRFIASQWGFYSSVINSDYGTVVRINKDSPSLSDSMLIYTLQSTLSTMYNEYVGPDIPTPVDPGPEPPGPDQPPEELPKSDLFLTFDLVDAQSLDTLLPALSARNMTGTFCVTAENRLTADDAVRRVVASGHSLAIKTTLSLPDGRTKDAGSLLLELKDTNDALRAAAMSPTRLVVLQADSPALDAETAEQLRLHGYRVWHASFAPRDDAARALLSSVNRLFRNRTQPAVLDLRADDISASSLGGLLTSLQQRFAYRNIYEWTDPLTR